MEKKNNKGSISGTTLGWVWRMILLLVIFFVIYGIITVGISRSISTNQIESEIIKSRLLLGKGCLYYQDSDKIYYGIIDYNKINKDTINECFNENKKIALNITLIEQDSGINNLIYNSDVYDLKFSCKFKKPKYSCFERSEYVNYFKNGILKSGIILINGVVANE